MSTAASFYDIGRRWESGATAEESAQLKEFIRGLVKYDCKIACKNNHDAVDIYVFSEKKCKITDWLELQPSGAIGVVFDEYTDPGSRRVAELNDACEDYNEARCVEFESDDETDSEEASSDTKEEEEN